jgi:hypothetical protein
MRESCGTRLLPLNVIWHRISPLECPVSFVTFSVTGLFPWRVLFIWNVPGCRIRRLQWRRIIPSEYSLVQDYSHGMFSVTGLFPWNVLWHRIIPTEFQCYKIVSLERSVAQDYSHGMPSVTGLFPWNVLCRRTVWRRIIPWECPGTSQILLRTFAVPLKSVLCPASRSL